MREQQDRARIISKHSQPQCRGSDGEEYREGGAEREEGEEGENQLPERVKKKKSSMDWRCRRL